MNSSMLVSQEFFLYRDIRLSIFPSLCRDKELVCRDISKCFLMISAYLLSRHLFIVTTMFFCHLPSLLLQQRCQVSLHSLLSSALTMS